MNERADSGGGIFWDDADDDAALQRYRTLVNAVDDGIYQLDAEGRFIAVNDIIVELSGYSREEILGEHVSLVLEDDDIERVGRDIYKRLANGESGGTNATFEITAQTASGDEIPCELQFSLLLEDGTFRGSVGIVRDISDRRRAERALQERERQLQNERDLTDKVLDTSPVAILVRDENGEVLRVNRRGRELFGVDGSEAYAPSQGAIYDEHERRLSIDEYPFARALKTGEPVYDRRLQVERPDGDRRWLSVNVTPVLSDDEEIERVITTGQDVTDLKEREQSLEQRTDELTTELNEIYGRITDGFIALNEDWEFTHVNDRGEEILGIDEAKLLGTNVWEAFPEVSGTAFEKHYRETMVTQEPRSIEEYYPPLDMWFEEHIYPSETGLSIYFQDVTERKAKEQQLREREQDLERYQEYTDDILNAVDDLFYVVDEELNFQRWNNSLCRVTGYSDAEVESMHPLEFVAEEDHETMANRIAEVFETGSARVEATVLTKDGERIPYEFAAVSLSDPAGDRVLAGIGRNIANRIEREEKLEDAVEKLEDSNHRLEQFAYAASHDLQEPLRMVSSYLQLLESRYGDELDEDAESFIEFAIDGAERMREMIDGLLEYSRVETRGDPLEPIELDDVFDDVCEDLRLHLEESGTEITADPLPRVHGDASQLRQLFQNLLDNAITYSGDEPPRVNVSAERDGSTWRIAVSDEGIGIDPDDQERIFEVFQRLHSREEYSGTGIGLALCERIVERHGGRLRVESEPGVETTFSFTLPVADDTGA